MITGYPYELWDGHKVVGVFHSMFPLHGKSLTFYETGLYKRHFDKNYKQLVFKLSTRVVEETHADRLTRTVIDVRWKTKRQIALLHERGNSP